MNSEQAKQVEAVRRIVCQRMQGQGAGHDVDHVLRVHRVAREIQAEVGGDLFVIELAALLHDIGDAKFHDGKERSGEFSREILGELLVDPASIERVAEIVDTISFRKAADRATLSLEAQVVQDADRLDAMGAVGIVRTIEYGASVGQPFHIGEHADASERTGLGHFEDKLFRLAALMNTEPARRIAGQRHDFMKQFVDQYLAECGQAEHRG
ncbi:HD domain-containing protein [Rosistilla oblonga]|uniref:HD domain-containing protein n=1 Tax=Rosistilla oblonga TaxID=2527990 RepID=UPI003A976F58